MAHHPLVFGTVVLDRIRQIPAWPDPGTFCEYSSESCHLGGEAANTAVGLVAFSKDIQPILVCNPLGTKLGLQDFLKQKYVTQIHELMGAVRDPECEIYVTPDGERSMFGANWEIDLTKTPGIEPQNGNPNWFTADANLEGATLQAFLEASQAGYLTYLMDVDEEFFEQDFAPTVVQHQHPGEIDAEGIQDALDLLKVTSGEEESFFILTAGSAGFGIGYQGDARWLAPGYVDPAPLDATGCGDAFRAAFLGSIITGEPLAVALHYADLAGMINCKTIGATSNPVSKQDLEKLSFMHSNAKIRFTEALKGFPIPHWVNPV